MAMTGKSSAQTSQYQINKGFNMTELTFDELRRKFNSAWTLLDDNRAKQDNDMDYYNGKQLSQETVTELKKRGQPVIQFNCIDSAVDGILGVINSQMTQPIAYPRQQHAEDAANITTRLLQYVADEIDINKIKLQYASDMIIAGDCAVVGGVKKKVNKKTGEEDIEITMNPIRYEEFFFDPYSREHDFRDASYLGMAKWFDLDKVKARFPGARDMVISNDSSSLGVAGMTDRPEYNNWVDGKRQRLLVIDMYYQSYDEESNEPIWYHAVFCGYDVLLHERSGFYDDCGYEICPIMGISCRIDRDNHRYGLVRGMIDAQDEINARRSKLLHVVNVHQIQQVDPNAPMVSMETVRKESARPDGVIPSGWQIVPTQDMAQGQQILYQDARAFIDRRAPTPAVLGRVSQATSGRQLLVEQQAGLTELQVTLNRVADLETRMYRFCWFAIQQFWTATKTVAVSGDPEAPEYLTINDPIMGPVQRPVIDPQTGQPVIDPMTGQPQMQVVMAPVGMNNHVAKLDMNIELKITPESASMQFEIYEQIMELLKTGVQITDPVFDFVLELAPIQDKARLKNMIEDLRTKSQEANAQSQQLQQQALIENHQSQMQESASKTQANQAKAIKDVTDAQSTSLDNQTKEMQNEMLDQMTQLTYKGLFPFGQQ